MTEPDDDCLPPDEELDMIVEEMTGKPSQRPTPAGIAKVEQRIAYLTAMKSKLLDQFNDPVQDSESSAKLRAHVRSCDADLTKARTLLADLQRAYEARN